MPVKAQDAAEGLEPEGMRKTFKHFLGAEFIDNNQGYFPRQFDHAVKQPVRSFASMERQIGNTGAGRTFSAVQNTSPLITAGTAASSAAG